MVYKRSLPPPSVRAIRKNQETISKRNMAVDAGKSAYVRGKGNGLVEVPSGRGFPGKPTGQRPRYDNMNRNRIDPVARSKAARERAILTNQSIVSSRNMAADEGRSTYVRGKNAGLVSVPNIFVRRRPSDMDRGFGPKRDPRQDDGNRRKPVPPIIRKRRGSGSTGRMGKGVR